MQQLDIRHSAIEDLPEMERIYAYARGFMAENGNPNQWGPTNWPPLELLLEDIQRKKSYCVVCEGSVVGTFFFDFGEDIEPTYAHIEAGAWLDNSAYGVVHRLAGDGSVRGIAAAALSYALQRSKGHMRVDTHGDNKIMQSLLPKFGFVRTGTIYVEEDDYPRIAYEIIHKD